MAANKQTGKKRAGPGRPKGSLNKTTKSAREAMELAFSGIGGVPALIRWAKENTTEFFKLYGRLIPVQNEHSGGVKVLIEYVEADD